MPTPPNDFTAVLNQCRTILQQCIVSANDAAASAHIAEQIAELVSGLAPLNSPHFTGIPTAPTADPGTSTTQLATTEYLDRLIGVADGLATLDSGGLIPASQLPPLALTHVYVVNSQAAMLALDAVVGDLAVRTDVTETYILSALPPSTLGNWTELLFAAPVTSVAGLTGAITATALTAALNVFPGDSGSGSIQGLVPAATAGDAAALKVLGAGGGWVVRAPLASPTFTGVPIAPTATVDTNTGQIASTAFVLAQASAVGDGTPAMDGTASRGAGTHYARNDHVHPTDTSRAPLASPTLTGTPAAPTASPGTNTTQIATTAFVAAAAAAGVVSFNTRTGAVVPASGDYAVADVTGAAPLASPTLTGTPAAPTPGSNVNTTQIVTGAWVNTYFLTQTGAASTYAPLASPALTGTPTAPTVVSAADSTTKIATTAFVQAAIMASVSGVSSWNTRTGAVVPASGDYTVSQVTGAAPLASPALTGSPTAPTQTAADNSTKIATTAYSDAAAAASLFPSGTVMLFRQTSAPTGWTKITTYNDVGIRLTSGTVSQDTSHSAFSTVFAQTATGGHALTAAEQANMSVSATGTSSGTYSGSSSVTIHNQGSDGGAVVSGVSTNGDSGTSSLTGTSSGSYSGSASVTGTATGGGTTGGAHSHTVALQLNYVDVILASKN